MSVKNTYTYDPDKVIILVGGVPITWSGDVVISRDEDVTTTMVGTTGRDQCVSANRNRLGTATIPLMAQSAEDIAFRVWSQSAEKGVLPFYLVDKSTNMIMATNCWYKTQADLTYAADTPLRAHVIQLSDASLSPLDAASNLFDQFESLLEFGENLTA